MKTALIVIAVLAAVGGLIWLLSRGDNKGDGSEGLGKVPDGDRFGGGD